MKRNNNIITLLVISIIITSVLGIAGVLFNIKSKFIGFFDGNNRSTIINDKKTKKEKVVLDDETILKCFDYRISGNKVTINNYYDYVTDDMTESPCPRDVIIPREIEGIPVTVIGNYAFEDKQITSLEIPDSVTTIGINAFRSNQLTSVIIPDSVTTMDMAAFMWNSLTSVKISNNLTTISRYAFHDNQLTSVEIPDSVTIIDSQAFEKNPLISIDIPNGVTTIGLGAFRSDQLTKVTISESVTNIDQQAFMWNNLEKVCIKGKSSSSDFDEFAPNVFYSAFASGYGYYNVYYENANGSDYATNCSD